MFGTTPLWIPTHPGLSRFAPVQRSGGVAPDVVRAPVDIEYWASRDDLGRSARPVIGRYDADTDLAWPDSRAVLRQAYPLAADMDVRILGGVETALRVLKRMTVPPRWLVYRHDDLTLRTFLHQLDFFVYFPSDRQTFPPVDVMARAMASGTVVVLPERFDEFFGEAAVYCSPEQLKRTLLRYHVDQELYRGQVDTALRFVKQHHLPSVYLQQIEDLISRQTGGQPAGRLAGHA
jgi:hypothetical protein